MFTFNNNKFEIKFKNGYAVSVLLKFADLAEIAIIGTSSFMDVKTFIETGKMVPDEGDVYFAKSDEVASIMEKVSAFIPEKEITMETLYNQIKSGLTLVKDYGTVKNSFMYHINRKNQYERTLLVTDKDDAVQNPDYFPSVHDITFADAKECYNEIMKYIHLGYQKHLALQK